MLKTALIGYGGIAHVHAPAYADLEAQGLTKLVAVCDIDEKKFTEKVELNIGTGDGVKTEDIHTYTDLEKLLEAEEFDVADICLPTPLHAPIANRLMRAGKHVLCEKPMARTYMLCREMIETARTHDRKLMIGQCLRFFPEYIKLKELIDSGEYGKPVSAVFRRMSGPPLWAWDNWYMDTERSGGVLQDMSIHDLDMTRQLFGEPKAVSCTLKGIYSGCDSAHSVLHYDGFTALCIGDWSYEGVPFTADFMVGLEKATVVLSGGKLTLYVRGGEKQEISLETRNGYHDEIEFFHKYIRDGGDNVLNPPESAAATVRLVERLRESAQAGGQKLIYASEETELPKLENAF